MDLDSVLRKHGLTKTQVTRELNIGSTTLWRITHGRGVKGSIAKKLCDRFPELDFEKLTLGDQSRAARRSI